MQYIFVHGLGQNSSSWEKMLSSATNPISQVCPELSEFLSDKEAIYDNLYRSFSEYCNKLPTPINLCGLSLGAILALNYTIDNPSRVKSLTLIGAQYKMPVALLKLQNIIFHFMPNLAFKSVGFQKKEFIKLTKSMMHLDFSEELKNIICPTLVVCGDKDNANKKASNKLAEYIPNAQLYILKNAGHEVNVDAPKELAELLKL